MLSDMSNGYERMEGTEDSVSALSLLASAIFGRARVFSLDQCAQRAIEDDSEIRRLKGKKDIGGTKRREAIQRFPHPQHGDEICPKQASLL